MIRKILIATAALVAATQTASAGQTWNGVEKTVPTGATLLAVELPPSSH